TGVRTSIVRPGPTLTEMGTRWDPHAIEGMVGEFKKWGVLRHGSLLRPEAVASAVAYIVGAPRGTHITLVDLQPEGGNPI
ncbi:MAG: SDR family oxidoreductase, partial [Actinomycetota bacterium]